MMKAIFPSVQSLQLDVENEESAHSSFADRFVSNSRMTVGRYTRVCTASCSKTCTCVWISEIKVIPGC